MFFIIKWSCVVTKHDILETLPSTLRSEDKEKRRRKNRSSRRVDSCIDYRAPAKVNNHKFVR